MSATRQILRVAIATLALSGPVLAAPDESATRAARELGNEGIELYENGDYVSALDRLQRAYGVIRVPTLGLWLARALVQNGRLVEASERYLEVSRAAPTVDEPPLFAIARADAAAEYDALQRRLPTLVITLDGAPAGSVVVEVDGKPLDANLIGVPVAFNPGTRQVVARRDGETTTESVILREGEKHAVVLRFSAPPTAAQPPMEASEAPPVPAPPPAADAGRGHARSTQRILAYVAFGVGGAGLATGIVSHALAKGKERDLGEVCEDGLCPTASQGDIDSYYTLTTVAPVGVVVGGVGIAAGATLWLTAPREAPKQARVTPFVGWGSAGVKGVF